MLGNILSVGGENLSAGREKCSDSSVAQLCLTLWDPMNSNTPGLPVHHQLPEFTQTHVHQVDDAIQPSLPPLTPSSPAFNLSQHEGLFQWVSFFASGGQSTGGSASVPVLPMNIQDWFPLGWTGLMSLQSKRLSRVYHEKEISHLQKDKNGMISLIWGI